jgi:hypothetical protein
MAGGGGEEEQHFAVGVELELVVDPVAGDRGAARVAGKVELALVGNGVAGDGVGGFELRTVGKYAVADEADGVVEEWVRTGGGDGLAGVTLVADPDVAVVVIASLAGALGQ